LVQVEALFSWTPVITYAWLWSTDIVYDAINGKLLTDKTQLPWAICDLFEHTISSRQQIRSSVVEKFCWNTVAYQYALLLESITSKYKT
jgi:hypothetical protein